MTIASLLAPIRERVEKATAGPWFIARDDKSTAMSLVGPIKTNKYHEYKSGIIAAQTYASTLGEAENNAELIAHAPTDLTRLIRAVEVLSEALEILEVAVNDKVNDPGATGFIRNALTKAKSILEDGS